jgi:hypothetical protein
MKDEMTDRTEYHSDVVRHNKLRFMLINGIDKLQDKYAK